MSVAKVVIVLRVRRWAPREFLEEWGAPPEQPQLPMVMISNSFSGKVQHIRSAKNKYDVLEESITYCVSSLRH